MIKFILLCVEIQHIRFIINKKKKFIKKIPIFKIKLYKKYLFNIKM